MIVTIINATEKNPIMYTNAKKVAVDKGKHFEQVVIDFVDGTQKIVYCDSVIVDE